MRLPARLAVAALLVAPITTSLSAQYDVVHAKPVRLRYLTGTVVDQTGAAIQYASVELRSVTDHHVVASTFADANGKFLFSDRKRGERFEVRVSANGFNSAQYAVFLSLVGKGQLRVVLPVGT